MENIIIVGIIIILFLVGLRSTIKHMKGEGACCGGGSTVKPRRKKLNKIIRKKTIKIDGMHCEQCRNRVMRCMNEIDGVVSKVNLRKKEAVIFYEEEVDDEIIRQAIENIGYEVLEISCKS